MSYPPQPGGYNPYGQQPGYYQPAYAGMPAPPPQPGDRPQKVTLGSMSMVALAVLALFNALIGVIFNNQVTSNYTEWCKDLYSDVSSYSSSCESRSPGTLGFQMFSSVFGFLWVLVFIGAALFALRGFNWARITSFVVNGIFIAWQLVVMICAGAMTAFMETTASSLESSGGSAGGIDEIIPGWYFPATLIISIISIAVAGFSLAFLANREASEWFRANTLARAAGVI